MTFTLFFVQILLPIFSIAWGLFVGYRGTRFTLTLVETHVNDAGAYVFCLLITILVWFALAVLAGTLLFVGALKLFV